jgi:hypothetical protein
MPTTVSCDCVSRSIIFGNLILIALANMAMVLTVSTSMMFADFRAWAQRIWPWLGKMVSCPYCLSHWTSPVLLFLVRLNSERTTDWGLIGIWRTVVFWGSWTPWHYDPVSYFVYTWALIGTTVILAYGWLRLAGFVVSEPT